MKNKNTLNYVPASAKTAAQKKEEAKKNKSGGNLNENQRKRLLKKRVWTIATASLALILVLTLSLIFATYTPILYSELNNTAPTETTVSSGGLIDNGEFDLSKYLYNGLTSSVMQYPYMPEGWSLTENNATESISGVISHGDDVHGKVVKDLKGMGLNDEQINKVLKADLIDKESNQNTLLLYNKTVTNVRACFNSFSVAENGYLKIEVKIRTDIESGDGAYIALKTTSSDSAAAELSFVRINTNEEWQTYTFYIEGSKTSGKTLYLFVGLGTSDSPVQGFAEVDVAKANSSKKADYITNSEKPADLVKTKSYVQNTANDKNLFGAYEIKDESGSALPGTTMSDLPFYGEPKVYTVENDAASGKKGAYIKLTSDLLKLNQSTATPYYRFSFWAKTEDILNNTGAYFYASTFGGADGNKWLQQYCKSFDLIKTSTATDDVNSGWAEYSFLLQPDTTMPYKVEFIFALGSLSTDDGITYSPSNSNYSTTGKLHVTEFELKEIYPSEYNNASDGTSVKKISITASTSTGLVTNGHFDSPVANSYYSESDIPAGLDPNGWSINVPRTKTQSGYAYAPHTANDVLFGIVSKNSANKTDFLGADADSYFNHTGDDNILAINIKQATSIGFTSNKFNLDANSYYIISFMVKTSSEKVSARLVGDIEQAFDKLTGADDAFYMLDSFVIEDGYKQFSFIVKTGDKSKSVALELWVGSNSPSYNGSEWKTEDFAPAGTIVAFDEVKTQVINKNKFDEIAQLKEGDKAIFTKTETEGPVKDEDGNDTDKTEVKDVTYTTEKVNLWMRDFSYADKSDALPTTDETPAEEENTVPAPINWLLLSSLIFAVVIIIFLVAMIVRKFRSNKKNKFVAEDPEYKK